MVFNSIEFGIFFPLAFLIYWLLNNRLKFQNLFIVGASFFFYGWWDWRFLFLLLYTSLIDYAVAIYLGKTEKNGVRKILMAISLITNLSLLGYFKYYNFFVASFSDAFHLFGKQINLTTLNILLPVGISFYTFQSLSYTIEVYRKTLTPNKNLVSFLAFVSFFPVLVAGPIERATRLLPQFNFPREFNYEKAKDGLRLILWGLFKKIVIADNCAIHTNAIFSDYQHTNGTGLIMGALNFSFQMYCDFSGYSDIAIGSAKMMGFTLMKNFDRPFSSKNITEFWRRWHISLSTWFNDYLFIPLSIATRNWGTASIYFSLFITFFLSGLWHGAGWNFIAYGCLHGIALIYEFRTKKIRKYFSKHINTHLYKTVSVITTFCYVSFSWIFFRSNSLQCAFDYLHRIFTLGIFAIPDKGKGALGWILLLVIIEWIQRDKEHVLAFQNAPAWRRWVIYHALVLSILMMGGKSDTFIYFQF